MRDQDSLPVATADARHQGGTAVRAGTSAAHRRPAARAQQPDEVRKAVKQHQQDGKWPAYKTPNHELYPYDEGHEPVVDCAPLRTTDIQLEPGETITDLASGDSERWLVTPAASGDPRNPTPHLAIKPTAAGISTNLTIYTTKHIYHLMLRSRSAHAMQEVAFYYPEELEQAMQNADHAAAKLREPSSQPDEVVASLASLDPGALNFSYSVSGQKVPWRPIRAFDDGTHVFIEMPTTVPRQHKLDSSRRLRKRATVLEVKVALTFPPPSMGRWEGGGKVRLTVLQCRMLAPRNTGFENRVEDDQQLAHGGGERQLARLTGAQQAPSARSNWT